MPGSSGLEPIDSNLRSSSTQLSGKGIELVFLHAGSRELTGGGEKAIDSAQFFNRLGQRVIHILTSHTRAGKAFDLAWEMIVARLEEQSLRGDAPFFDPPVAATLPFSSAPKS